MVSTKDYLSLSALAYVDFESVDKGKTIGSLADGVKDGTVSRKEFDLDRPQLSALRDSSNPLRLVHLDFLPHLSLKLNNSFIVIRTKNYRTYTF